MNCLVTLEEVLWVEFCFPPKDRLKGEPSSLPRVTVAGHEVVVDIISQGKTRSPWSRVTSNPA